MRLVIFLRFRRIYIDLHILVDHSLSSVLTCFLKYWNFICNSNYIKRRLLLMMLWLSSWLRFTKCKRIR